MRNAGLAHAVNRTAGHTIQRNRNGSDIIFCEHQAEHRDKRIGFHLCIALYPGKLLHRLHENLPQLAIFFRCLQPSGILMQLRTRSNAVRCADALQKGIQCLCILLRSLRLFQILLQCQQRLYRFFAQCIECYELFPRFIIQFAAKAVRMSRKRL